MSSRPAGVVSAATRLAAKAQADRAARRRRIARRLLGASAAVLVAGLGAWLLLSSPLLAVRSVVVRGASGLTAADVRLAANAERGVPLAKIDAAAVLRRLRAVPGIAGAQVVRDWPSTLELQVRERVAVAGLVTPTGVRLIDRTGVPFGSVPALPPGLVRLQVDVEGPADPTTQAALAVLAELPAPLRGTVRIVRAASASSVLLVLRDGRQVLWGGPGDAALKAAAAQALLAMPGTVFDVSRPGVVTRR